jgi:hypothetical protein
MPSSSKPTGGHKRPTASPRDHRFIALSDRALTRLEAEERVLSVIRAYGATEDKDAIMQRGVTFTDPAGKATKLKFADLAAETQRTGVVPTLDHDLWLRTTPRRTLSYAADSPAFSGNITTGVRTSAEAKMPGYATSDVVSDILGDVLFYRAETARLSTITQDAYKSSFRAYRAYLGSCITAIDAFLNSRVWFALNEAGRNWTASDIKTLKNRMLPLNKKLEQWVPILTGGQSVGATTEAWLSYNRIRESRNAYVHANEPDYVYSLREATVGLNLCQSGVGQLLLDVSMLLAENPHPRSLSVRYAHEALFVPVG